MFNIERAPSLDDTSTEILYKGIMTDLVQTCFSKAVNIRTLLSYQLFENAKYISRVSQLQ